MDRSWPSLFDEFFDFMATYTLGPSSYGGGVYSFGLVPLCPGMTHIWEGHALAGSHRSWLDRQVSAGYRHR